MMKNQQLSDWIHHAKFRKFYAPVAKSSLPFANLNSPEKTVDANVVVVVVVVIDVDVAAVAVSLKMRSHKIFW